MRGAQRVDAVLYGSRHPPCDHPSLAEGDEEDKEDAREEGKGEEAEAWMNREEEEEEEETEEEEACLSRAATCPSILHPMVADEANEEEEERKVVEGGGAAAPTNDTLHATRCGSASPHTAPEWFVPWQSQ